MHYAWLGVWVLVSITVPRRKVQRGYVWTLLRKLPPWRWVPGWQMTRWFLRFAMLCVPWGYLCAHIAATELTETAMFYAGLTLLELDDYLNGDDDDRKRRREWARNKIRWLMELPAPPQEVKDVA